MCKSQVGTVLLLDCGNGRPGWHRKQLFGGGGCGVGVGVGESFQRTKNLPLQTLRGCPATRLPNSQRTYALHTHSHPPERSMESREGAGAKKCRIKDTKHSPALPLPQAHRFICCQQGQNVYAKPAYHKHTLTPTLVLPSEPVCRNTHASAHTHTHSHSCGYVLTHTTIPKSNKQQRVGDYFLCSRSCPLRSQDESWR